MRWSTATVLLAGIVGAYTHLPDVNPTTVALTLLLFVLLLASIWGFRYAVVASFVSALCFNYFFLPPIGTFTIADSQNWIALIAFLATALIGSNLSNRIRTEAAAANQRRRELELLYDFGQRLLSTESTQDLLHAIPQNIVSAFRTRSAALYLLQGDRVYYSNTQNVQASRETLRRAVYAPNSFKEAAAALALPAAVQAGLPNQLQTHAGLQSALLALMVGVKPVGAIAVEGNLPSQETLEAMSGLIAIAIESATAVEKLARADAAHESERLRAALLDSVTHDLRTPLTSIKASVTSLLTQGLSDGARTELLTVIDEESDRLNHLIAQATEMASLDAHEVHLDPREHSARECVEEALLACSAALADRKVEVRLADTLPHVRVDLELITKVLVHLLENAVKYSAAGTPIFVSGAAEGQELLLSVADRGYGIEALEQEMIFDKFYRGQSQRHRVQGTGMGLAISKAILEAHSGTIGVTSQPGSGSVFTIRLPLE